MLSLLGPVAEVTAVAGTSRLHRMETEDVVAFPGRPERLAITGTTGAAILEAGTLELHYLDGRSERHGEITGSGGNADPMAFPYDWRPLARVCSSPSRPWIA